MGAGENARNVSVDPSGGGDDAVSEVKRLLKKLELVGDSYESYGEYQTLVKNFSIPNSKEEILEFAIAASGRPETVWKGKLEEAYSRAEIVGADDEKFLKQINAIKAGIEEKKAAAKVQAKKREKSLKKKILTGVTIFVVFCVVMYGGIFLSLGIAEKKEIQRLEALQTEILEDLRNDNLLEAKLKVAKLKWEHDGDRDTIRTWDEKRTTFLKEIAAREK
jgi:ABC-type Na+ efflux pump permease subunit